MLRLQFWPLENPPSENWNLGRSWHVKTFQFWPPENTPPPPPGPQEVCGDYFLYSLRIPSSFLFVVRRFTWEIRSVACTVLVAVALLWHISPVVYFLFYKSGPLPQHTYILHVPGSQILALLSALCFLLEVHFVCASSHHSIKKHESYTANFSNYIFI